MRASVTVAVVKTRVEPLMLPPSILEPLRERVGASAYVPVLIPGRPVTGPVHPVWRVVENDLRNEAFDRIWKKHGASGSGAKT